MKELRWRPLFVLGIDRSGTSLVSELLSLWGAHAGDRELLGEANAGNPHGYFEYEPMQEFVSSLIHGAGRPVWEPGFMDLMRQQASDPELRRRALDLAAGMECADRPWFWKEPGFVLTLPFWTQLFPDAVYLITLRNPCDSAASYKRFFVPPVLSDKLEVRVYFYLRWQFFMITIFGELKSYPHKLVVSYEELLQSPQAQCERICGFLDAEYDAILRAPERANRMAQAISPDLWRNKGLVPFSAAPDASEPQKELFTYLRSRVDGDFVDFEPSRYPFPQFFGEYMSNMNAFQWLLNNL